MPRHILIASLIAVPLAAWAVPPANLVAAVLSGHWTEVYSYDAVTGVPQGDAALLAEAVRRGADIRVRFAEPNATSIQVFSCSNVRLDFATSEVTCFTAPEPGAARNAAGVWTIDSAGEGSPRTDVYTLGTNGQISQVASWQSGLSSLLPNGRAPAAVGTTTWFVRY